MFRTPKKLTMNKIESSPKATNENTTLKTEAAGPAKSVRRSVGEWESGTPDPHSKNHTSPRKYVSKVSPKPKTKTATSQDFGLGASRLIVEAKESLPKQATTKYVDRLSEARACVTKAKTHLGNSRNLKTEIKTEVIQAIDRLYALIKETEVSKIKISNKAKEQEELAESTMAKGKDSSFPVAILGHEREKKDSELITKLEEHTQLLKVNNDKMETLKELLEKKTYASAVAAPEKWQNAELTTLHSVVVTSQDEQDTGEEVLNRIRDAVNAKDGGITVEKIRKAKDQKVIVGCKTKEEREKVKERLKIAGDRLNVEDIKNKNPLVILKDLLQYNKDEEIITALKNQNSNLFKGLSEENSTIEIAYKKKTRNPQTSHVIMRVSPTIWQRMTETGSVRVDLQRIRVADQSPLVQCSRCLGYGHGRRFCNDTLEKCSHCGGPHLKAACASWLAGDTASCCNCVQAKLENTNHNAFSLDCTIRRRWDAIARATIAYC